MSDATTGAHAPAPMRSQTAEPGFARGGVRAILRAEGLALFAAAAALYAHFGFSWLAFAALFLAPDLTFAGYLLGPKWGAAGYNFAHSTLLPLAVGCVGLALGLPWMQAIALIGLAHIGFDRALGFGLKYSSGFGDSHLGRAGHSKS